MKHEKMVKRNVNTYHPPILNIETCLLTHQRNVQVSTFSNMKTEYTSCNFFQQREIWGCRSAKIGSHFHRLSGISNRAEWGNAEVIFFIWAFCG